MREELEQHRHIRELFTHVKRAQGRRTQQAFDELHILLTVHETAEEMVLRPVSCQDAGAAVADARNQEEREATRMLSVLEAVNVSSAEFGRMFTEFEQVVLDHAEREEQEEFPPVRARESQSTLVGMGAVLRAAEINSADPPASLDCGLADRAVDGGAVGLRDRPGPGRDEGRHAAKLSHR